MPFSLSCFPQNLSRVECKLGLYCVVSEKASENCALRLTHQKIMLGRNMHRGLSSVAVSTRRMGCENKLFAASAIRYAHSVRLIALEDLPHGKGYKGDVLSVKAGYARNYLVPQKKAVYATPQNFELLGIVDPNFETEEQRLARLQRESSMDAKAEQYLKETDMLKKYLRTKTVSVMVNERCDLLAFSFLVDWKQWIKTSSSD